MKDSLRVQIRNINRKRRLKRYEIVDVEIINFDV